MTKHNPAFDPRNPRIDQIANDVLKPVGLNSKFHAWMGF